MSTISTVSFPPEVVAPGTATEEVVPPGSEGASLVAGETSAAFASVLELCATPIAKVPVVPSTDVGESSRPTHASSDRPVPPSLGSAKDVPGSAVPRRLSATIRSLGMSPTSAMPEPDEADEDASPVFPSVARKTDTDLVEADKIQVQAPILPLPSTLPQSVIVSGLPVGNFGPPDADADESVVEKSLQHTTGGMNTRSQYPREASRIPIAESWSAEKTASVVAPVPASTPSIPPGVAASHRDVIDLALDGTKLVDVAPEASSGAPTGAAIPTQKSTAPASIHLAEKVAAPEAQVSSRTDGALTNDGDINFLDSDKQRDATEVRKHGTGNAKASPDMQATTDPTFAPPSAAQSRAAMEGVDFVVQPVQSAITTNADSRLESASRSEPSIHAVDAAGVVREVAELTHDFRLRERSSVEVKFDFQDATEVSVRLAYRDGDVHTTFRTDSAELRAALSREWQGYAGTFAQESRGFRIADPVFTSSGDFNASSQGRDSGFSAGGDARQQQPPPHPDHPGTHRAASAAGAFQFTSGASVSSVQPTVATRISADRLLHVFA